MPIPDHQLTQLRTDLLAHEKRLLSLKAIAADAQHGLAQLRPDQPDYQKRSQSLKNLLADAENETTLHETLIKLGQDPKVLAALGEIHDKPEVADQLQSNPQAFTQARGIQLPPGLTITATRSTPHSAVVSAHYQAGRLQNRMNWDLDKGFTSQEIR